MTTVDPSPDTGAPLAGLRVLEAATGRPARIAAMLLADLGADVVRAIDPEAPEESISPETICWDRGKRIVAIDRARVAAAADRADVMIVDAGPTALPELGWDAATVRRTRPGLVHLWMPPYGEQGEWKDVPEDPLLLAGLSLQPYFYPADDDGPIAAVGPILSYLQAAIGAAAAVAGVIGRQRHGLGQASVVTGMHAVACLMGTALARIVDGPQIAPGRDAKGVPNWRVYRCSDGQWIYLAALTPDIFFRALDVMDRMDVMALPDVAGDWQNIMRPGPGRDAVTAELEPVLAANSSAYWLARFGAVRVPCATVHPRSEWLSGPIVAGNQGRVERPHPAVGPVALPNVPIGFSRTPVAVRGLAIDDAAQHPGPLWPDDDGHDDDRSDEARVNVGTGTDAGPLPLAGIRVVDGTSFVAGPTISALLADFGADVVRVEPPGGDTYRAYSLSFLVVNQRKRGITLDQKQPAGRATLHRLLAGTDIYVENLRPHAVADLELAEDQPTPRFPGLVHCSLSAFGRAEEFADQPGFDPVFQLLSGLALAQGGGDRPVVGGAPANDVASGALGALGSLAALHRRLRGGSGQRVWVSLAASASFIQSGELTTWAGSPAPQSGTADFRGPDAGHRYHRCADGWIAVAAIGSGPRAELAAALGLTDLTDPVAVQAVLAGEDVATAVARIAAAGVPVCRVVSNEVRLDDPFLLANDFDHRVPVPEGVARVVDHFSRWPDAGARRPGAYFAPGQHNAEVLGELGDPVRS